MKLAKEITPLTSELKKELTQLRKEMKKSIKKNPIYIIYHDKFEFPLNDYYLKTQLPKKGEIVGIYSPYYTNRKLLGLRATRMGQIFYRDFVL
jgi:ABC-type Zn uptake system ZnuABC Zn-binding protein ZnuA